MRQPVYQTNLPSTPEDARFLLRVNPRLLLVAAGGESSYAAVVRGHAGEDRDAAVAGGMRRAQIGAIFDDGAGLAGGVSTDAPAKTVISGRCRLAGGETGPFRRRWEHRGPRRGKTLQRKALRCNEPVGIKLRHFLTSNTAQRLYKRE